MGKKYVSCVCTLVHCKPEKILGCQKYLFDLPIWVIHISSVIVLLVRCFPGSYVRLGSDLICTNKAIGLNIAVIHVSPDASLWLLGGTVLGFAHCSGLLSQCSAVEQGNRGTVFAVLLLH
jgi:hypothetical protein